MKKIKRYLSILLIALALFLPFTAKAITAPAATTINVEGIGNLSDIKNNMIWNLQMDTSSANYTHILITVTPADPTYVVTGAGQIDLIIGEKKAVIITITNPADNTSESYTINITLSVKESGGTNPNTGTFANYGLLGGISACCAAIYVFQKNKNKFYKI